MAIDRCVLIVTTVEYTIPAGSAIGEFAKAYDRAASEYKERYEMKPGLPIPHDDWAVIDTNSEGDIVIRFQLDREEG